MLQSIKRIQIMFLREDQEAERGKTLSQDKADCYTTNVIIGIILLLTCSLKTTQHNQMYHIIFP